MLGAAIQTAKFGKVPFADALELVGWGLLLLSGLMGLSRFEWLPEIYRLWSIQIEKEDLAKGVHKATLSGMREIYVGPLKKSVSATQFVAEAEASAKLVEDALKPIERRQFLKYRIAKWTFVAATCSLLCARAYLPVLGIVGALTR